MSVLLWVYIQNYMLGFDNPNNINIVCVPLFCTAAHCGHLGRIDHNERLIISISFVISVVMMGRFLNTIRHNEILREMTRGFKFPFKGDRIIQVKRTKKTIMGLPKGGCDGLIEVAV